MEADQDRARPHKASYGADLFMYERDSEERPYYPWDFYYKHCALVSRNPYPVGNEHSCTDPK